jgi:hypothetical protein
MKNSLFLLCKRGEAIFLFRFCLLATYGNFVIIGGDLRRGERDGFFGSKK